MPYFSGVKSFQAEASDFEDQKAERVTHELFKLSSAAAASCVSKMETIRQ